MVRTRTSFTMLAVIGILTIPQADIARSASHFVGDATLGEKVFKKCKACHKVGADAKNSTGPVLNNIVGRAAASYEGYGYGKSMRAAGAKGLVWDEEQIFNYILNPKKYLRAYLDNKKAKAKMKFKLKNEEDRKNVIAYLVKISKPSEKQTAMVNPGKGSKAANAALSRYEAMKNEICIQNNFPRKLLLTVEAKGGERNIRMVGQTGYLCVKSIGDGTVGVFENEDALEGCSRLAKVGKTEVLIDYASFDNCAWKE